ncbi:PLP-dependent aspartate aminotransferase family protein [Kiloniella laminariae]|uniref:PLP-dependent aspartate aminotransferase family protein n=2 Tax=Kiloniella laminariae TaxID=454162 RepID=A0ABT4LK10_9PROT|nr:PLP-dependent aspartate aminotransferase family protein [Kiloniella laminariae]MCZ4280332.1 PLP-dependent aspartate aminotransferase family protein [Kiloniella laminariae]
MMGKKNKAETILAQAGHYLDKATGSVVPPIQPSTTFARDEQGALYDANRIYARDQSVNAEMVEAVICELESGEACKLFASGMAAATALVQTLRPGERIVAPKVMYWSLRAWLISFCQDWGIELAFYDPCDEVDMAQVVHASPTHLLWVETPANPTWEVVDIAKAAELAHSVGAQLVTDSTVSTPLLTRPLELGADYVFHSATKYLNGHSDVVAGAVITAKQDTRWERLCKIRAQQGGILGPFESWLLLRGMRTMHIRVERACYNAMEIARHFADYPGVLEVLYPGLVSHPNHETAVKQMSGGFGGMLSIRFDGGREQTAQIMGRLKRFVRATSLGGVESLVEHRALVEGEGSPVPDDLLRFSIGIEAVQDLIEDLEQAIKG